MQTQVRRKYELRKTTKIMDRMNMEFLEDCLKEVRAPLLTKRATSLSLLSAFKTLVDGGLATGHFSVYYNMGTLNIGIQAQDAVVHSMGSISRHQEVEDSWGGLLISFSQHAISGAHSCQIRTLSHHQSVRCDHISEMSGTARYKWLKYIP